MKLVGSSDWLGVLGGRSSTSGFDSTLEVKQELFEVRCDLGISGELKEHVTFPVAHSRDCDRSACDHDGEYATERQAGQQNGEPVPPRRRLCCDLPCCAGENRAEYHDDAPRSVRATLGDLDVGGHIIERDVALLGCLRKAGADNNAVASQDERIGKKPCPELPEDNLGMLWCIAQRQR